jgi:phage terminase large subunit
VNVGDRPTRTRWPDGKRAKDKFVNLKAELHWVVRDKLRHTYEHWLHMNGDGGIQHELDDLLLLPDDSALAAELSLPRYMKMETGKIQIESKRSMATRGIASPDHADALVLTFAPTPVRHGSTRTVGHW